MMKLKMPLAALCPVGLQGRDADGFQSIRCRPDLVIGILHLQDQPVQLHTEGIGGGAVPLPPNLRAQLLKLRNARAQGLGCLPQLGGLCNVAGIQCPPPLSYR